MCSVTATSTNPWWAVDLGSIQAISSITITQAAPLAGSLSGFQIYVGNANSSFGDPNNVLCPNPFTDSESRLSNSELCRFAHVYVLLALQSR